MKTFVKIQLAVGTAIVLGGFIVKTILFSKKKKNFSSNSSEEYPEDLIREQLSRNYSFVGEEQMMNLRNSFVVVVGAGGVGSHAVHMMARSGISHIRVIDFDQVTLSSLNRHAVATLNDVGKGKCNVLRDRIKQICPWVVIESVQAKFEGSTADFLLRSVNGKLPDLIVDCIDNIDTKVELLTWAVRNGIKIVSSSGAGAKMDPTKIQITDISETQEDSLARATRRKLKKNGISSGIDVVFSTEKPNDSVRLLPLPEDKFNQLKSDATIVPVEEYAVLPNFRVRILPVIGTIPAIFGCTLASYVVNKIANLPVEYIGFKNRHSEYLRLHKDLCNREKDVFGSPEKTPLDLKDIEFLFEEVWRGRSAISGKKDKLCFVRRDISKAAFPYNVILLTQSEMVDYLNGTLSIDKETLLKIDGKLETAKNHFDF